MPQVAFFVADDDTALRTVLQLQALSRARYACAWTATRRRCGAGGEARGAGDTRSSPGSVMPAGTAFDLCPRISKKKMRPQSCPVYVPMRRAAHFS